MTQSNGNNGDRNRPGRYGQENEASRSRVARYRYRQRAVRRDPRLEGAYQERPRVRDGLDDEIDNAVEEGRPVDMGVINNMDTGEESGPNPDDVLDLENHPESTDGPDVPRGPGQRIAAAGKSNKDYKKEYELRLLYRMLLRNLPLDLIARSMNCSVKTVVRRRKELYELLAEQAAEIPMELHAGQTLAFYNEIRGICMRMATEKSAKNSEKLGALEIALKSEQGKHAFLEKAGFYDTGKLPPKRNESDPHHRGADTLSKMANELLYGGDESAVADAVNQHEDDDDAELSTPQVL